jgi:membrane protease YdiL (CAAX protease family)
MARHLGLRTDLDMPRAVALAAPVLLPVAMTATFALARKRTSDRAAYSAGFAVYWATCAVLSIAILGRRGLRDVFRDSEPGRSRSSAWTTALLAWPALGAIATRLVPEMHGATPASVATIAAVATINATVEELFWRGVYTSLWPDDMTLGVLWPSFGFAAWHLAPQVIHPSKMGGASYVTASLALGLSWSLAARRAGSIRWTTLSHIATDGSGLANAEFFIGG